ncbi:hypothetical protein J2Y48_000470 [Mycoplana sp. BE70]|uniref:hypothetical protein n=1 Tax=Mycoplana sp. BE70 TaxID=2817775 RepID=UPI00285E6E70|nr:hypothetical protein [Mycoplana sp. BE70]MDR6755197.1 hypothetical protein [Mycoplana sp. BE70]
MAWGCGRPTQRAKGKGLSETHCKSHVEFHRRHGSYWCKSFTKAELAPYRKAASVWLKAKQDIPMMSRVIAALQEMIDSSGSQVSAYALRGLPPERRADAVLANLRAAGKSGRQLLLLTLTIKAAQSDLGPRGDREFLHVQIAKATHRLASGTHRTPSGFPIKSKYPRAEGRFMRTLGFKIEDTAGIVADYEAAQEVRDLAHSFKRET